MKSYTITVNGVAYDVTVEETDGSTQTGTPRAAAPRAAAPKAAAPKAAAGAGNIKVEAGASGKVVSVDKKVGDSVGAGDTILVLEVMKMETPVVAPKAGTIASIDTEVGKHVEAGELLATMNE
ncbi:MAG: biotin/lipoyl-containing protein [Lachnospiraceae bacterium]